MEQQSSGPGIPIQGSDQASARMAPPPASAAPVSWGTSSGTATGGAPTPDLSRQLTQLRQGFTFGDFITFRYMITPPLATVIYIVAVVAITLGSLALLTVNALVALVTWVFLMLWVRVVFEVMIVLFRINDGVQATARRP